MSCKTESFLKLMRRINWMIYINVLKSLPSNEPQCWSFLVSLRDKPVCSWNFLLQYASFFSCLFYHPWKQLSLNPWLSTFQFQVIHRAKPRKEYLLTNQCFKFQEYFSISMRMTKVACAKSVAKLRGIGDHLAYSIVIISSGQAVIIVEQCVLMTNIEINDCNRYE